MGNSLQATYAVVADERILRIEQEELDTDALQPHEVLIEAESSVVSAGTELAIFTALAPGVRTPGSWNAYPWRPGYGVVGHVVSKGRDVTRVAPGDRVFSFGKHASRQFYDASGSKPMTGIFPIETDIPAERAAMARLALIAMTGPQVSEFEVGDTVVVFGLGLVGNLAAQLYQIGGARVIAFDMVEYRCDLARQVGLAEVHCVTHEQQQ